MQATSINNIPLCATWSETSHVHIWDMSHMIDAVNNAKSMENYQQDNESKPLFTFRGHTSEGFAIDWAQSMPGLDFIIY